MEQFESKYNILDRVYADTRLKRTSKAIMQYLVMKSDHLSCHPSIATIANAINMSERTVQRHMTLLEQYGYIRRRSRFYRQEQLTNQYEFILDVFDSDDMVRKSMAGNVDHDMINSINQEVHQSARKTKAYYIKKIIKTKLSPRESLVLIYLIHRANRAGIMYGSTAVMAKQLHMSERLLVSTFRLLRQKGYLKLKGSRNVVIKLMPEESWIQGQICRSGNKNKAQIADKGEAAANVYPESAYIYKKKTFEESGYNNCEKIPGKRRWKIRAVFTHLWKKVCHKIMRFIS